MQGSRAWLAVRAGFAVLFTIAFYALAVGLVFVLARGGVGLLTHTLRAKPGFYPVLGAVLLLGLAAALAWAMLPRRRKFEPPGPEVTRATQPALFLEIARVSAATGQELPAHVYVDGAVNAAVFQAGGFAGFGATRRMVVGLPLLAGLTVSQARSVLAHEFGHYYGGDIALGPWIHRTREALGRTILALSAVARHGGEVDARIGIAAWLVRLPFRGYAWAFGRLTNAISRRQELVADGLAARVAGRASAADALRAVARSAALFGPYVQGELEPIAARGMLPPVADGFTRFLRSTHGGSEAMRAAIERGLSEETQDPYDSHPPTRVRIAAIEALDAASGPPFPAAEDDARPALALLRDVEALEREIYRRAGPGKGAAFSPVRWEETGERALPAVWRESAAPWLAALAGRTPEDAPAALAKPPAAPPGVDARSFPAALASALALAIRSEGWRVENLPGEDVAFVREGRRIRPFPVFGRLGEKAPPLAEWASLVAEAGIAGRDLGRPP
jgi:Zn-dependent protease with chaperone function